MTCIQPPAPTTGNRSPERASALSIRLHLVPVVPVLALALALLVPLGCGRDRSGDATTPAATQAATPAATAAPADATAQAAAPMTAGEPEATPDASEAAPRDQTPGEPEAVPPPAESAPKAGQADSTSGAAKEREELARKQRELDAREARLAQREAALRKSSTQPETAPRETAPAAPEPSSVGGVEDQVAAAPADPVTDAGDSTAAGDDDWRRSSYRTDPAAREGYDPAPTAGSEMDGAPDSGDGWTDEPAPEPAVTWTTELLPADTRFTVELLQTVASDRNRSGDTFRARVMDDVTRGGEVVIPAGSIVRGKITEAVPLNPKVGGRARLGLQFFELQPPGAEAVPIDADFAAKGKNETARDAATIGGAAAGGAILGRVLNRGDKGKGSVIGAILGAAVGTAIASHTEGQEVALPEGAQVELVLTRPAEVPVREPR